MRAIEIGVMFMVFKRAEFDPIELAAELRTARRSKGLTVSEIAEICDVPVTEAEHWFRTDRYNAPPSVDIWEKVKDVLQIEGWDCVGKSHAIPNVFEMGARAYLSEGLCPTVTVTNAGWVMV